MSLKVVIADSDKQNVRLMKNILSPGGYEIFTASSISESYPLISANSPDIIIIDPLYPLKEGINLIKSVREWNQCPIIAVSSNTTERAIIDLLDAGADDYIKKPFLSSEFSARLRVAARHINLLNATRVSNANRFYSSKNLRVEFDSHIVTVDNKPIHLTKNEFRILSVLCQYAGRVLTYDFIMKTIWGPQASGNNGILRVNVTNLRKKIEKDSLNPQYIYTENGIGYRIAKDDSF